MFQFVKDAWKELNNGETLPDMELWKFEGSNENTPQQRNDYDCGAFCCMFALKIAKGEQFNFSQSDIANFRIEISNTINRHNIT